MAETITSTGRVPSTGARLGPVLDATTARAIALKMHRDQRDKAGQPYGSHILAVERGVEVLGGNLDERIAALFHDAVEDGHATIPDLRALGATEETLVMVEAVTKRRDEHNDVYLSRIIAAGPGAMRVKVADLLHNTRHDRVEALRQSQTGTADGIDFRLAKYRRSLSLLMGELGLLP